MASRRGCRALRTLRSSRARGRWAPPCRPAGWLARAAGRSSECRARTRVPRARLARSRARLTRRGIRRRPALPRPAQFLRSPRCRGANSSAAASLRPRQPPSPIPSHPMMPHTRRHGSIRVPTTVAPPPPVGTMSSRLSPGPIPGFRNGSSAPRPPGASRSSSRPSMSYIHTSSRRMASSSRCMASLSYFLFPVSSRSYSAWLHSAWLLRPTRPRLASSSRMRTPRLFPYSFYRHSFYHLFSSAPQTSFVGAAAAADDRTSVLLLALPSSRLSQPAFHIPWATPNAARHRGSSLVLAPARRGGGGARPAKARPFALRVSSPERASRPGRRARPTAIPPPDTASPHACAFVCVNSLPTCAALRLQ